jgi:ribose transport system substrate-binding protein
VGVEINRPEVAKANSAWIAKDSGGKANVLLIRDDEFPETKVTADAYKGELSKACSGCKVGGDISFTLALASQRLAGDVAQALRGNPNINYIVLPFDTVSTFVSQGIREAGKTGKVKMVGLGGDPPSLQAIKSGDMVESFGTQAEWMGWDAVDGLVRIFAGSKVPPINAATKSNYLVTGRYVTKDNLPEGDHWDGDFDYPSKFKELWGK